MSKTQVNIYDPNNYRPIRQKQVELYVCKPEVGTMVISQPSKKQFTLLTLKQQKRLAKSRGETLETMQSLWQYDLKGIPVTEQAPFVYTGFSGGKKRLKVMTLEELCSGEYFLSSKNIPITPKILKQLMGDKGYIPWVSVTYKPQETCMAKAVFVPKAQKLQLPNGKGVNTNNDKYPGDFVICNCYPDGSLNLDTMRALDGRTFAQLYDNRGWGDCLTHNDWLTEDLPAVGADDITGKLKELYNELLYIIKEEDKAEDHVECYCSNGAVILKNTKTKKGAKFISIGDGELKAVWYGIKDKKPIISDDPYELSDVVSFEIIRR